MLNLDLNQILMQAMEINRQKQASQLAREQADMQRQDFKIRQEQYNTDRQYQTEQRAKQAEQEQAQMANQLAFRNIESAAKAGRQDQIDFWAKSNPEAFDLWNQKQRELEKWNLERQKTQAEIAKMGKEGDPKRSGYAQQLVDAGYEPGTQPFIDEMRKYNAADVTRLEKGGITINTGEKQLPTTTVGEFASADTAATLTGSLREDYEKLQAQYGGGILDMAKAKARSLVPGTPEYNYLDKRRKAAQTVGLFMEEGKLQASDFPRYESGFPDPWEPVSSGASKFDAYMSGIDAKASSKRRNLKGSGYRVPDAQQRPSAGGKTTNPLKYLP